MHDAQRKVREFHEKVVGGPTSPARPELRDAMLRARLIIEEAFETVEALVGTDGALDVIDEFADKLERATTTHVGVANRPAFNQKKPDLAEAVDGLCDLIYVAYGSAEAIGVDLEPYFDEVHRSNMAKENRDVDGHGKRGGKPPGWQPPRIAEMLAAATEKWDADVAARQILVNDILKRNG